MNFPFDATVNGIRLHVLGGNEKMWKVWENGKLSYISGVAHKIQENNKPLIEF